MKRTFLSAQTTNRILLASSRGTPMNLSQRNECHREPIEQAGACEKQPTKSSDVKLPLLFGRRGAEPVELLGLDTVRTPRHERAMSLQHSSSLRPCTAPESSVLRRNGHSSGKSPSAHLNGENVKTSKQTPSLSSPSEGGDSNQVFVVRP